jgi:uncharacterized membrane protein
MKSRAAIADHPLHPMLVGLPIGLFIWTLTADIIYLATDRNVLWYDIAFYSGIAAWVSALVAALPGLVDFLSIAVKSDAKGMATAHMAINVTVVVLYIVATAVMFDHGALSGGNLTLVVILHAVGTGILGVSGWLGGEMVYRYHLSMIPDDLDVERAEQRRHYEGAPSIGRPRI